MSDNGKTQKKKRLRMPLIVKITLLFTAAAILGTLLVFSISRNIRMERAIQQGGESALNGCYIALMMLELYDPDYNILRDSEDLYNEFDVDMSFTDFQKIVDETRGTLRNRYYSSVCSTLELKYLYLYTVDDNHVRHHIISVAGDPEEDKYMKEHADYGTTSDDPLDENEIRALNNDVSDNPYFVTDNSYGYVCSCIIPVTDKEGNVYGLIGADSDMSAILKVYNKNQLLLYILIGLFFLILLIISAVLLHFAVIKPARVLSKTMRSFADDPNTAIRKRKVWIQDEISDMEHSFRVMAGDIRNYIGNIEKLTKDKIQADVQMEDAQRIQRGMVPPEIQVDAKNFSFYAVMNPALEVGGDFYDALRLSDGRFAFLIADVSGKGISAALFMAMVKRVLRDKLISLRDPALALTEANKDIYNENPEGLFATVFAVIYDPWKGKIIYSNAGHTNPVFFGKKIEMVSVETGGLLGIFDDTVYTAYERYLGVGEGVFLYTDGTTEAVNTEKEPFGEERLLQLFDNEPGDTCSMVKRIRDKVIEYEGDAGLFDDLTMLAMCRVSEGFLLDEIQLKPELSELQKLKEMVLNAIGDSERSRMILVAAEEWLVNLTSYSGTSFIGIKMEYYGDSLDDNDDYSMLIIEFEDDGAAFDPTTYVPKEKEFEDLMFGGMGIGIIKEKTKQLTWERKNEHNIVRMYFDLEDQIPVS